MPYVSRDADNAVSGIFSNAQPGYAEEWREEEDDAVIAFRQRTDALFAPPEEKPSDPIERFKAFLNANPDVKALLGL